MFVLILIDCVKCDESVNICDIFLFNFEFWFNFNDGIVELIFCYEILWLKWNILYNIDI